MKFLAYILVLLLIAPVATAGEQDALGVDEQDVQQQILPSEEVLTERERLDQMASRGEIRVATFTITAYTVAEDECGRNESDVNYGRTASGEFAEIGMVATGEIFPFGTRLYIDGVGYVVVKDRGGDISNNRIDILTETKEEAFKFGRQERKVFIFD